jgi:hypothetical protein
MLAVDNKSSQSGDPASPLLPFENGDSLHSQEFLRRYERMPQLKKAELIEGVVYIGSPTCRTIRTVGSSPDLVLPVEPLLACDTATVLRYAVSLESGAP